MVEFKQKLIAVLNEKIDQGKLMNALAHMSLGLGQSIANKEELRMTNYKDVDEDHQNISEIPFIILKTNNTKLHELRWKLKGEGIQFVDFTQNMTEGTFEEQLARSLQTKESDQIYFGIVLFGDWVTVSELTRKYSLWR